MTLVNITVIYSGSDKEASMLSYADKLCADHGVKANCLFMLPEIETAVRTAFAGSASMVMHEKYYESIRTEQRERTQYAKREFDSLACSNLKWVSEVGSPRETTAYYGKFSDMLILYKNISEDFEYTDVVQAAIFETGRPIILHPGYKDYNGIDNVLIAWDGSARAAKAVKSSLDIIKKSKNITVLTVDESEKDTSSIKELIDYLASHGIKAVHKNISKIGRCVGDEILNESKKQNADLIIMGAYTHNKMRQIVFGGATKFILANTDIPVFMEH